MCNTLWFFSSTKGLDCVESQHCKSKTHMHFGAIKEDMSTKTMQLPALVEQRVSEVPDTLQ